jgi:hypothetical protein
MAPLNLSTYFTLYTYLVIAYAGASTYIQFNFYTTGTAKNVVTFFTAHS